MGIAERHGDENETTWTYDFDTAPGERFGIAHVLQDVAAQNRFGPERADARKIGVIQDIGSDVDALALARVQMDQLHAARFQGHEQMLFGPGLLHLAEPSCAAADVQKRRQLFGRPLPQQSFQPGCLGFEHNGPTFCRRRLRQSPPARNALILRGSAPINRGARYVGQRRWRPPRDAGVGPFMPKQNETLEGLRREIDEIDAALHDLLIRRAEVSHAIAKVKQPGALQAKARSCLRCGRRAKRPFCAV